MATAFDTVLRAVWEIGLELFSAGRVMRHIGEVAVQAPEPGKAPVEKKKSWVFLGGLTDAEERLFAKILQGVGKKESLIIALFVEWMLREAKKGGPNGHEMFINCRNFLVRIAKDFVEDEITCKKNLSDLAHQGLGDDGNGRNFQAMYRYALMTRMMADSNKELLDYIWTQMDNPTVFPWKQADQLLGMINDFLEERRQKRKRVPNDAWGVLKFYLTPPWK